MCLQFLYLMLFLGTAIATPPIAELLKGMTNFVENVPCHTFVICVILWWALANSISLPILKSLPSVVVEILKENAQFWEAPLAQGYAHFSSLASAVAEILKGNPNIIGSSTSLGPRPRFPLGVILWWALETQAAYQIWIR